MMHLMFAARFACVSITPLGREVEPLVNWRNATSSRRDLLGLAAARCDSRIALDGDDLLERGHAGLHRAEQALDLRAS